MKSKVHPGGYLFIETFKNGKKVRELGPIHNHVVSSSGYGRNLIARQLGGDTTYPLEITTISIGDSNTAPVDANTALGNALETGLTVTEATVSNDVLVVKVFVADGDMADDTYEEVGYYCGTQLFSRIIISPAYTKATGEDTLFTYTLTISD